MDYSNLVFKVDVKELVDADKKVSQLGDAVEHTSTAMDHMARTSSRNVARELNNLRDNATGSEKAAIKLSDAFGKLGQVGGTVGSIAGSFAELFKWMGSAGQAQKTFTSEAKLANQALGEGNKLFNASNALLAANTAATAKAASAAKDFRESFKMKQGLDDMDTFTQSRNVMARQVIKRNKEAEFWKKQPDSVKQEVRANFSDALQYRAAAAEAAQLEANAASLMRTAAITSAAFVAIPVLAGAAFMAIAQGARDAADKDAELAEKIGVTTDRLAVLQLIASENGATVEGLARTYDKLSRSLNKMDEDNAKTIYSFESLGIALDEVKNKRPEVVAGLIMANYEKLGQSTKATAAVVQLLGPNFREQSLAVKQAADNLDAYTERVQKFGGVASANLIKQGADQESALSNLAQAWKELKNQIAESTTTMSTSIANWAADVVKSVADAIRSIRELEIERKALESAQASKGLSGQPRGLEIQRQAQNDVDNAYLAGTGPYPTLAVVADRVKVLLAEEVQVKKTEAAYASWRDTAKEIGIFGLRKKSAAATLPGKEDKGKKDDELQHYIRIFKLQQEALEEYAKDQKLIDEYNANEEKRRLTFMRDMLNFQEDLTSSAQQWSEVIMKGDFAMIRAQSQSPMDQAGAQFKSQQDSIRSQFGTQASDLTRKAGEAFDNGDFQAYLQLTEQAAKATEVMNEKLRESQWVFKKVQVDSEDAWAGMKAGAKSFADSIPTLNIAFASFSQSVLGEFADRLTNLFMEGKFGFEDFVKSAIAQLIKLQMQMAIMKGLQFFGIGGSPAVAPKALGGAYSGGVEFFANGGVFNSPTMFGTAGGLGVMGEKGPEAVMPLRRGRDGKLGVAATTGGNVQVVNNINVSVQGGNTNSDTGNAVAEAVMKRIADQRIYNATRSGGIIRQSLA